MSQFDLAARAYAPVSTEIDLEALTLDLESHAVHQVQTAAPRLARHGRELPAVRLRRPATPVEEPRPVREPRRPTDEEINARAHQIFLARGGAEGNPVVDWLEAEMQLIEELAHAD